MFVSPATIANHYNTILCKTIKAQKAKHSAAQQVVAAKNMEFLIWEFQPGQGGPIMLPRSMDSIQ
jgi:hypothetical protein